MSGAMLAGAVGGEARQSAGDAESGDVDTRSVDRGVAAMRRRIGASHRVLARRLGWALGGAAIGGTALALWQNSFPVAAALAHGLARLL